MSELRLSIELQASVLELARQLQLEPEQCVQMLLNEHALWQQVESPSMAWMKAYSAVSSQHQALLKDFGL